MKELEDRRREATQAAEMAKQQVALMKQREQKAWEATKAAVDAARQKAKGLGRGLVAKRPAPEAAAGEAAAEEAPEKRAAVEVEAADTLPTVRDGDDIE